MANNQYVNKVDFGDDTLIDLTSDTVTEDTLVTGYTAHTRSGATITGTLSDATTSTHGLMSANDKSKLDGIISGAAVTDVQINSTSILNNGVANIPYASLDTFGVTKIASGYGLFVDTTYNTLKVSGADISTIKAGTHYYRPIVPVHQHESVFYGLAKAAGDSTQSASSNTVGNYTDTAKTAIHNMLDSANRIHKTINSKMDIYFEDGADNLPMSNVKIKFSVQTSNGVGDPSPTNVYTFVPYSQAYINHWGKNLFDSESELIIWIDTNNNMTYPNGTKAVVFPAEPDDYYTLSIKEKVSGSTMEIVYFDENINILKRTAYSTSNVRTFTSVAPANTFMVLASITAFDKVSEVQFEKSRVETPYEAIKGTYYYVSWEDEAGAIYGGELNITTGVLTVTKAKVALGSLDYYITNSSPLHFVCDSNMTNHITFGDRDFVCTQYKTVKETYWTDMPDYSIMGHETNNSLFRICDSRYSDVASFKAALTEQGAELVYTLETPITYQLTPIEIKSFLGKNRMVSNSGSIYTAEYQADTSLAVPDIQINGKSIVENYVANIPVASSTLGLVKIDNANGIGITSGKLFVVKSNDAAVKAGTANYQPIVPSTQHAAAFYGLAKAAGDSTQSASSNAVGIYTTNAKTAIQNMLSVPSTDSPTFTGSFSQNRKANTTVGPVSAVIGYDNAAEGSGAIAMGYNNMAYAQGSIALGTLNTIYGDGAVAIGYKNIAQYQSSFVFGSYNAIDTITDWASNVEYDVGDLVYNNAYVLKCLTAHTSGSTLDWSKWTMTLKNLFTLGNGNGENERSNALVVNFNGDLRIKGNLYIDCNADSSGGTILAPIEVIRL